MATTVSPSGLLTISFFHFLLSNPALSSPLIDQLNHPPPPNFLSTITNNCLHDSSLRYCNSTSSDLTNIFKSTIVAAHLCNLSNSPNCPTSFSFIDLRTRPKLAPLYLSFSFFWKYCPFSIQSIDLSNNSLAGPFPSQILNCTQIHSLDLSHNMLSGFLPIDSFTLLTNLSSLNLSYNQFSQEFDAGAISFFKRFNDSSFIHSGLLKSDRDYKFKMMTTILLLVGVSALIASAIGCLVRRIGGRHKFSVRELTKATDGFSKERLVEKREKMEVYIGILKDGEEVEIEIQRGKVSSEFRRSFVKDCRVLVKVRHKNIVKVLGWCDGREMRAVVMEREEGVSIEEWLMRSPPWKDRMKVAMKVIEAMSFLEEEWPQIRCDVKTTNVMVSEGEEPLILKLKVHDHPNSSSREIYKFGVFLLQLIANKHLREEFEGSESRFVDWIAMHQHEKLRNIIDENMKLSATAHEQARQAIEIGLICTDLSTEKMLTVNQISSMLRVVYMPSMIQSVDGHHHRTRNKKKETT
ncbi:putative leucine-rich repeat receptor-like serine/threonine-protein kinase At2g24130 [Dendrobium catenatum]|uniref:LRR receptor-like serine/threonine-protein kinase GSO1 n=1 Tax=Dendrobium catenatum TaxID=906689 RepID=A0A2I0WX73_9ASPA|nr:putative leucine-rich repeat receptor-like serine/threonine-protein kinase At2g24130 [Dendrobium catenatum]PKU80251.1 LRR receptor-like serine/threonine-protein kinase GSO1 [Dendrobium catenatum]